MMLLYFLLFGVSVVLAHPSNVYIEAKRTPRPLADLECSLTQDEIDEIQSYQADVDLIFNAFTDGVFKGRTYDLLAELTDTFGHRLTGSQALEDAIDWVIERGTDFDQAYAESVSVPIWNRNEESLYMVFPRQEKLHLIGLGSSVATPPDGISAEIVVVSSYADLDEKQEQVPGKIVVYDYDYISYSNDATYRFSGASRASEYGAVASLIRSVTGFSIQSPHTGIQFYDDDITPIPTACISVEDSGLLRRLTERGETVWLNLTMGAQTEENAISRNTFLELTGQEIPDEYVLVSGHMDSWDVGNGVIDDASGCVLSWTAGIAMKELNLLPKRTLQVVMFTSEEQSIYGGYAFFDQHVEDADKYQIMMEADLGIFNPSGMAVTSNDTKSYCVMQEILSLLPDTNMTQFLEGASTPDLYSWIDVGVPLGSPITDDVEYFWYHHSEGDNMEVVDSDELDQLAALWTSVAYVLADINFSIVNDLI